MRKLLYILAFTTLAFAVSCDSNVDINANANPASTEEKTSDTISNSIDSQNSNINGLESEIELLKKELENANDDRERLEAKIDYLKEQNKPWGMYLSICASVLAIIAIILHFILQKGLDSEDVGDIIHNSKTINKLKEDVSRLENTRTPKTADSRQQTRKEQDIEPRLSRLESKIKELDVSVKEITTSLQQDTSTSSNNVDQIKKQTYNRIGYAKINTELYFTDIFDSNQEGCVFKIQFNSEQIGQFGIIALDKIKSRNGWQKIVECSGLSIEAAKDFQLIESGVCKKIDEKTWEVIKPLKIRLK